MMSFGSKLDPSLVKDVLPDWPAGPLDRYRSKASFDWRHMKLILEGEEVIRFKQKVWNTFQSDPLFARNSWDDLPRDEERRRTTLRLRKLAEYNFVDQQDYIDNPYLVPSFIQSIGQYDWSLCLKRELSTEYFILNAKTGTTDEDKKLAGDLKAAHALGAIVITELAHGSDTKMLRTTATYDPSAKQFILETPDLEATKVWCGVLGQTATHAVVFAQLCTPDGAKHGIHQFLVPIRNVETLKPLPGLVIGDIGAKAGLNGLDNGFMTFCKYRVPRSALMNKNADVTDDGKYISPLTSNDRMGKTLGILSCGRVFIILKSVSNLQMAVAIATRYSGARKQFGPAGCDEWPVLEYQSQQWRLIPYIAAAYVLNAYFVSVYRDWIDFLIGSFALDSPQELEMGSELHVISSVGKAMCGWIARDAIQEARECCGGHGYLKAARFADLRNDHDANNTYEGDNHVLMQQTSNFLLKLHRERKDEGNFRFPFGSFTFLEQLDDILTLKQTGQIDSLDSVWQALQYLTCWLLKKSADKLDSFENVNAFVARSQSQVYHLRSLAMVFFECDCLRRYIVILKELNSTPTSIQRMLTDLGFLYGLWTLEKYTGLLIEAGYFKVHEKPLEQTQNGILSLCSKLKDDAVTLVDVFSPPDFILNSCLGKADGNIYENIYEAISKNQGAFERPQWFDELKCKL